MNNFITQLTVPTPFEVGDVHVYLLKGDMLTLVDAGVKTNEARESIMTQLRELGYKPVDIEQIILTHHHADHIGLIEEFPRLQYLTAHENTAPWLTRNKSFENENIQFFAALYDQTGIPKDLHHPALSELMILFQFAGNGSLTATIQEGDVLPGHPDFKVIETKGHAQTHLSFLRERYGLFIGGDHLIKHISPNPMIEAPMEGTKTRPKPMLDYRNSLKKCLDLGISNVLPGHGEVFSEVAELINKRLINQEKRANKVYHLLQEKASTPFEICMRLFPKHYEKQLNLTMSETIGQLDYLMDIGMIDCTSEKGIMIYDAN